MHPNRKKPTGAKHVEQTNIVIVVPTARLTRSKPDVTIGAPHDRPEDVATEALRTITGYMRGTTFAVKQKDRNGKAVFSPVKPHRELRDADLIAHADKKKVIAAYPIAPGSDKTQCAVLDFDNHDGLSSWQQMIDAVREVMAELKKDHLSPSLLVRSRNGAGIHLWFLFTNLATAKAVRAYLTEVLEKCGFTDGEGGVAGRQIEIFPKQDSVEVGGYGNHITLPFAGSSVALDRDSFEIVDQVQISICGQPYRPKPQSQTSNGTPDDDGFDKAILLEALQHVSADERETRIQVGMAIKNSANDANFDDEEAFKIWADWTDTCTDRLDQRRRRDNWQGFKLRPKGHPKRLTLATVYKLAADNGWIRPQPTMDAQGRPIVTDEDHLARARRMRDLHRPHLLHYRDDFMDFDAGAYRVIEDGVINANTWTFLDGAQVRRKVGSGKSATWQNVPFQPDRNSVGETIAALKAVTHLDPVVRAPCWLNGRNGPPCDELIAFPNGLLDLRSNRLHPVDPNFFTIAALGFDYVDAAPKPVQFLRFLDGIFEGDDRTGQIDALQEMFGYMLIADTSQQKAFMLLGPKRSGKGTLLGVLRKLLASTAIAGPTLKSLGTNFGLMPLIGKQLAIIDDLRVGPPKEQDVLVENVLKITGRGLFTIDRKFKTAWTGSLPLKLLFVSNVMPKLGDDGGALAGRFITIVTRVSFFGREDTRLLEDKLAPELTGIFHWALAGLRRLRERGHFHETDTSKEARERLANLGSPARAFLVERCVLDPKAYVEKRALYEVWRNYAAENDLFSGTLEKFCEALYAAGGGLIKSGRPREGNSQINAVMGVRLQEDVVPNSFTEAATDRPMGRRKR